MGGKHLRAFSERIADVPAYLKRHLALIRDLDEKVAALQKEIEMHSRKRMASKATEGSAAKKQKTGDPPYDIDAALTRLLSLADEKVTIAGQVYDYIDRHIQLLDEDLKTLGDEIAADKQQTLGVPGTRAAVAAAAAANGGKLGRTGKRGAGVGVGKLEDGLGRGQQGLGKAKGGRGTGRGRGAASKLQIEPAPPGAEGVPPVVLVNEPGEHEPLYCFCQKPSHGSMVACDNDECPYEWFHYECVGMVEGPQQDQQWFCPHCTQERAKAATAAAAAHAGTKAGKHV